MELPLTPRSAVHHQTAYLLHRDHPRQLPQPSDVHANECTVASADVQFDDAWETQLLHVEEAQYVGALLTPLLGVVALLNDQDQRVAPPHDTTAYATAAHALPPPLAPPTHLSPAQPHHATPTPDLAPTTASSSALPTTGAPATLPEEALAVAHLCELEGPVWVEAGTPEARGYTPRPPKGKPLPRAPMRRQIERNCAWRVVITGPDYVGCTTLLRGLERVGHAVALAPHKPPPGARPHWC